MVRQSEAYSFLIHFNIMPKIYIASSFIFIAPVSFHSLMPRHMKKYI
jgi:hypothetical protein